MELAWVREHAPTWDSGKAAAFGSGDTTRPGSGGAGAPLPGDWWCVLDGDEPVGYCRMDSTWGDAELFVAVRPGRRGLGIGTFALRHAEAEASRQGMNYIRTTVPRTAPDRTRTVGWLLARGFRGRGNDEFRKRVWPAAPSSSRAVPGNQPSERS